MLVWEGDELPEQFVARRDAYMKEEFAKLLTADAGKLERLGYKSVDGAEEWVTVEVSDGAALIPFWIDLSDEGLYLLDGEEIDYRQLGAMSPSSIATATRMTSGEARRRYGDRGSLRCDRLYESSGVGTCDNRRENRSLPICITILRAILNRRVCPILTGCGGSSLAIRCRSNSGHWYCGMARCRISIFLLLPVSFTR